MTEETPETKLFSCCVVSVRMVKTDNDATLPEVTNGNQGNANQANVIQGNANRANATQGNINRAYATQGNATQRNVPQRNATQRNARQANVNQGDTANNESNESASFWNSSCTQAEKKLIFLHVMCLIVVMIFWIGLNFIAIAIRNNSQDPSKVCYTEECKAEALVIMDSLDTYTDPCVDFYQYACGGWIEKHPIPPGRTRYTAFDVLKDEMSKNLTELLEEDVHENEGMPRAVKSAATFYQNCINEEARQSDGLKPLTFLLDEYMGWPMARTEWDDTGYQWHIQVAKIIKNLGIGAILSSSVGIDAKDGSKNIIFLNEADGGLNRNELLGLRSSQHNEDLILAYKEYMKSSAKLLNQKYDELILNRDVDRVVKFQSALALLGQISEDQRNYSSMHDKMTVKEMQVITENDIFEWKDFLNLMFEGYAIITDDTEVVLRDMDYVKNALKLVKNTDLRTVANYIGWQIVMRFGPQTTKEFLSNQFDYLKLKADFQDMPNRKAMCLDLVMKTLGFALNRLYVDRYVTAKMKNDMEKISKATAFAYHVALKSSSWMDDETKEKVLKKLGDMIFMIAYPSWIKKNENLDDYYKDVEELNGGQFFSSVLTLSKALMRKNLEKINETIDRTSKWGLFPTIINAHYNPDINRIIIPAGIINLPFYKYGRTMPLNFGAIGTVLGHEISHGFGPDVSVGNNENTIDNSLIWLSENVRRKFAERVKCFKEKYSSYIEPVTQMHLNGNFTVGENMADNGGLQSSYYAYKLVLMLYKNDTEVQNKELPGVFATPDQLFFIGYANTWCGSQTKMSMERTMLYDRHSPKRYRVLGPLSNFKAFSEAFNCPLGSPMNPESKCPVW